MKIMLIVLSFVLSNAKLGPSHLLVVPTPSQVAFLNPTQLEIFETLEIGIYTEVEFA